MKRIPALQPLSMEHHLSLSLAVKAMRVARGDDEAGKQALCERIVGEYADLWRPHFDAEERCLFEPFHGLSTEIDRLCALLTEEHRQFDAWVDSMKQGDCSMLEAFGELLQSHTRLEERQLFGLIEEQLDASRKAALEACLENSSSRN